jgi:hypothetical protein
MRKGSPAHVFTVSHTTHRQGDGIDQQLKALETDMVEHHERITALVVVLEAIRKQYDERIKADKLERSLIALPGPDLDHLFGTHPPGMFRSPHMTCANVC